MFGFRSYPTPILRPLGPFIAGSGIVFVSIWALQNKMLKMDVYRNHPNNPYSVEEMPPKDD